MPAYFLKHHPHFKPCPIRFSHLKKFFVKKLADIAGIYSSPRAASLGEKKSFT